MLFVQSFLVRCSVSIFSEGDLGDVEIAYGARSIDAAVGTSHTLDIAAVKATILSCFNGFEAAF